MPILTVVARRAHRHPTGVLWGSYGAPRVHAQLRQDGQRCGRRWVTRLMRALGLAGRYRRRRRQTTIPDPHASLHPDLIERDFTPDAAAVDTRWCGDITCVPTEEGLLYLATVIDIASRREVGWATADHLRTGLVAEALQQACARRRPTEPVIFHSDRGCQGGFNQCSQHLVVRGVGAWAWARNSRRSACIAVRSPRREGQLSPGDRTVSGSGKRSLEG
ncbi:DDE-type integrase/transposase/recombinase [Nonomuraea bangladeshensis]